MEINGETVTITGGALAILGIIVNFFRIIFKKLSKIEQLEDRADKQDKAIQSIKDSEIKDLESDIKELSTKIDVLGSSIPDIEKNLTNSINRNHEAVLKMFIELSKESKNDN
tara:strand:- start:1362 stop:1697 length:336 start_codon:yes stop_codon:yes gene_type:complete